MPKNQLSDHLQSKHHKQKRASPFIFILPHGYQHHYCPAVVVLPLLNHLATTNTHCNHRRVFPMPQQLLCSHALMLPLLCLTTSLATTFDHHQLPPPTTRTFLPNRGSPHCKNTPINTLMLKYIKRYNLHSILLYF